jgi:hydrogenase maturation protease
MNSDQTRSNSTGRTIVLGLGNLLLRDEGIGVHIVRILEERKILPPRIELIDGGVATLDVVEMFDENDRLIVIDAVRGGEEPGAIYTFRPGDVKSKYCATTSLHQLSFLEALRMASQIGKVPASITIIGVEPADMQFGMELSLVIKEKIPGIIEVVQRCIDRGGCAPESN